MHRRRLLVAPDINHERGPSAGVSAKTSIKQRRHRRQYHGEARHVIFYGEGLCGDETAPWPRKIAKHAISILLGASAWRNGLPDSNNSNGRRAAIYKRSYKLVPELSSRMSIAQLFYEHMKAGEHCVAPVTTAMKETSTNTAYSTTKQ